MKYYIACIFIDYDDTLTGVIARKRRWMWDKWIIVKKLSLNDYLTAEAALETLTDILTENLNYLNEKDKKINELKSLLNYGNKVEEVTTKLAPFRKNG